MRYTIEGFSQEYAITLKKTVVSGGKEKTIKIDCTDLVILRWFVDFFPNMKKMNYDGKDYAWLSHKKLAEDLPLLDISKRACIERMQKLVEFEILDYVCVKEGGTFSLYRFGKNYENLISNRNVNGIRSNVYGDGDESTQGIRSNDTGVYVQPANKDSSIIDSSIKDSSIKNKEIYIAVLGYLNKKAGTNFRASSKDTQKHIHARIEEGYTVDDFKAVIDKKVSAWKGTEYEQYIRPATLFGTKFESYLNAPATNRKTYGRTGVEIRQPAEDDLAGIL